MFLLLAGGLLLTLLVGLLLLIANRQTRPVGLGIAGCLLLVPFVGFFSYQSSVSHLESDFGGTPALTELGEPTGGSVTYVSRTQHVSWGVMLLPLTILAALGAGAWRCFDRRRPLAGGLLSFAAVALVLVVALRISHVNRGGPAQTATITFASPPAPTPTDQAWDELTEPRIALEATAEEAAPAASEPAPHETRVADSVAEAAEEEAAPPVDGRSAVSNENLAITLVIAGGVLLLVAVAYALLRIDQATGERYTLRLLLAAPVAILVLFGLLIAFNVTFQPGDW